MTAQAVQSLIDRLPAVQGSYEEDVPMSALTWFRVGGPAEVLFRPADTQDLAVFLAQVPKDISLTVIGVGSNLLVRDRGLPGVTIRLSRQFAYARREGDTLRCGASTPDANVALAARDAGLAGLEFLRGVPGTIGGACRMNAGAYGRELADILVSATAVDGDGQLQQLAHADFGFAYRHTSLADDYVFVEAVLRGTPDDPEQIALRMDQVSEDRKDSQPVKARTGGSTFKNPEGHKAWELIDAAGCRGLVRGGAQISEHHCNFLINTGTATAADLEDLALEVQRRVRDDSGITLELELAIVGERV